MLLTSQCLNYLECQVLLWVLLWLAYQPVLEMTSESHLLVENWLAKHLHEIGLNLLHLAALCVVGFDLLLQNSLQFRQLVLELVVLNLEVVQLGLQTLELSLAFLSESLRANSVLFKSEVNQKLKHILQHTFSFIGSSFCFWHHSESFLLI